MRISRVMRTSAYDLNIRNGRDFTWDYTILDEAHNIKVIVYFCFEMFRIFFLI